MKRGRAGDERTRKEIRQDASDKAEREYPGSAFPFLGKNAIITNAPESLAGGGEKKVNRNKREPQSALICGERSIL